MAHFSLSLASLAALVGVTHSAHSAHLAHGGASADQWWLAWTLNPILLIGLALVLGAYLYAVRPLRQKLDAPVVGRGQIIWFVAGWLTLVVALVSPLDHLGDEYLFSAHMVQHMLIAVLAPPLLLLGMPSWLADLLLPTATIRAAVRWLSHPIVTFGLFEGDLWLWHSPQLYDLTLQNDTVHIIEHLTFILLGVLFWMPILSPTRFAPRIARSFGILYLFLAGLPMVALGALITFSSAALYQPYVAAPRMWGISPLTDQQLGGLIMWVPTSAPYFIGMSILFFKWVSEQERAERMAAGEFDEPDSLEDDAPPQVHIPSVTPHLEQPEATGSIASPLGD